ncbi:TlpA family protein disulfide reductase [Methylophaga sp. OBS3]|uniref:TlpA family protein disulfide reductase n=1 Tax=Methylophaga sp. OBS3 TaxID=2991934 RepID=UPI00225782BE|nr:TlpA disulfide reductase family protein [Methylophaga sp. OBS3]MCX4188770.1 TlpA family protein disulfide reductase [Methylophaga sp. OBS3]
MKSALKIIFPALLIIAGLFFWLNSSSSAPMPNQRFDTIDGETKQLSDYVGKPLLVIFWATDCPGCIAEMPELVHLHEQYADLGMLGIALAHDTPEQIKAMRSEKSLPYTLTWDSDNKLSHAFGNVRVTPTHFLVDANGNIVMRKIGELDFAALAVRLEKMGLEPA